MLKKARVRMLMLVVLAALLLAITAGCGQQGGQQQAQGGGQAQEGQQEIVLGVGFRQLAATWSKGILAGIEERAKEYGYKLTVVDARLNPDLQLQQVDSFVQQKVDGVILVPQDPASIIPGLEKIKSANIPLYVVDTQPKGGQWNLFIAFDNVLGGRKAGEALEKLLVEKYGPDPKGVVLEIMGDLRHIAAHQRSQGFHEVIDKYKNIKVVKQPGDWVPDKAFQVTTDLLNRYGKEVIGITMAADCMAPGVVEAVAKLGYEYPKDNPKHIPITAIDGDPIALDFLRQGRIDAIALQPFNYYGSLAVEYLTKELKGEKVELQDGQVITKEGEPWSPARVEMTQNGPMLWLNSVIIPWEISIDDPHLWGNMLQGQK